MKKFLIISLAIVMIVSLFLPVCAFGENYDADFSFTFGDAVWHYRLRNNIGELSQSQINNRAVYRSHREKKRVAYGLVENGFTYEQVLNYIFPNLNSLLNKIEKKTDKKPRNAEYSASINGVKYTADQKGREINYEKLFKAVFGGGSVIQVPTQDIAPAVTLTSVKAKTALRAAFSTSFASSGAGRSHNIARALSSLDGVVIKNGERLSFNKIVGPRTEENGYKDAKIIVDGKYVDGVGGGVCQVSTTLYNALLLADIAVLNRSRHSLVSGYVLSGFDAMVSSSADLIFQNNTGEDVVITAGVRDRNAVIAVYGIKNPYQIKRVSVETKRIPPETQVIVDTEKKYADRVLYDDETFVLTNGSDNVEAEAYLVYYSGGKEVAKKLLHTDRYSPAPRIIVKGAEKRPQIAEGK